MNHVLPVSVIIIDFDPSCTRREITTARQDKESLPVLHEDLCFIVLFKFSIWEFPFA